jgi:fructokinase
MKSTFNIVGLGEVLWDCLPGGKQLGGAAANFAYVCTQLGNRGVIASRVGTDKSGDEILQELAAAGVDVSYLQRDRQCPTGTVKISLQDGQPSYQITENAAWDFLEWTPEWQHLAEKCDAVCFGSLAQRNAVARQTIGGFVRSTRRNCLKIFDLNLRRNYFSADLLRASLQPASVVKLNHEELPVVAELLGLKSSGEAERMQELRRNFDLNLVCLTRASRGSLLVDENEISEHSGIKVKIADTVGAGDSFTAALAHGILHHWNLAEINENANRVGAFVASSTGAMPEFPEGFKL